MLKILLKPGLRAAGAVLLISGLSACGGGSGDDTNTSCPNGQQYDAQQGRCVVVNTAPTITSANSLSLAAEQTDGTVVYTATATDAQGDSISWQLTDSKAIFSINSQ